MSGLNKWYVVLLAGLVIAITFYALMDAVFSSVWYSIFLLLAIVCISFLFAAITTFSPVKNALLMTLGFVLAQALIFFWDSLFTDKTHNLLGLEVIIYGSIMFLTSFTGGWLKKIMSR